MTTVINGTSTSASAPAVVGDDGDTGLYFPAANQVAIATAGTQRVFVGSTGNVGVGTNSPVEAMQVNGANAVPASEVFGFSVSGVSDATKALRMGYDNANDMGVIAASDYGSGWRSIAIQPTGSTGVVGIGLNPTSRNNTCLQIVNGLGFPATQVSSSDANTLDDYEEGTFTLVFADNTSGGNTKNVAASYTKIGNIVKIRFAAYYEALPTFTAGNQIYMRGLPFSTVGEGCAGSIMLQNSYGTSIPIYAWQPSGQTWFVVKLNDFVTGVVGSNLNGFALTTYGNLIYFTNT